MKATSKTISANMKSKKVMVKPLYWKRTISRMSWIISWRRETIVVRKESRALPDNAGSVVVIFYHLKQME